MIVQHAHNVVLDPQAALIAWSFVVLGWAHLFIKVVGFLGRSDAGSPIHPLAP